MGIYDGYLPELRSSTLFRDMTDAEILLVLDAMQPPIKSGGPQPEKDSDGNPQITAFRVVLRSAPAKALAPRHFRFDMPKFGEPGMMMAEIPALSCIKDYVKSQGRPKGLPQRPHHDDLELETLEFTPETITRFYSAESSPAQGKMLRNFLGILAQKVCDVRRELFLLRDGHDLYAGLDVDADGAGRQGRN